MILLRIGYYIVLCNSTSYRWITFDFKRFSCGQFWENNLRCIITCQSWVVPANYNTVLGDQVLLEFAERTGSLWSGGYSDDTPKIQKTLSLRFFNGQSKQVFTATSNGFMVKWLPWMIMNFMIFQHMWLCHGLSENGWTWAFFLAIS